MSINLNDSQMAALKWISDDWAPIPKGRRIHVSTLLALKRKKLVECRHTEGTTFQLRSGLGYKSFLWEWRKVKPVQPRHEWNKTKPMWVIGTIDGYGAIRGRASKNKYDSPMHGKEDGSGRRWRWNVWDQDFHPVLANKEGLIEEEYPLVMDWLEKHGYVYPRQ